MEEPPGRALLAPEAPHSTVLLFAQANQEWDVPAQQLVAQVNMRSNSLFPYVLKDVLVATPANDGSEVDLVVAVKRGDKEETISMKGQRKAGDHYGLLEFKTQPSPAT